MKASTDRVAYVDVIAAHAAHAPDAPAVRDHEKWVGFGRLWEAVAAVSESLRTRGIVAGDRVLIAAQPGAPYIAVLLGVMASGAVAVPLNTRLTSREVHQFASPLGPRLVICDDEHASVVNEGMNGGPDLGVMLLPAGKGGTIRDRLGELGRRLAPWSGSSPYVDANAPAIVFGTGGTTGLPKSATWTHRGLWLYASSCMAIMEIRHTDVELYFSPFFHIGLVTCPLSTLFAGGAVHVLPRFDADAVVDEIYRGEITRFFGAPTALERLVRRTDVGDGRPSAVRRILYGSSPSEKDLPKRLREAFPDAELITGYGATEFGAVVRTRSWEWSQDAPTGVGRPVPGVRLCVTDPATGQQLPHGEVGEIVVSAPWAMVGYWGQPTETAGAMASYGIRVGDLGCLDDDGHVHLVGRSKEVIITGGENVFPVEVESILVEHPAVREVVVFGVQDAEWGERVEAALVAADRAHLDVEELAAWARTQLSGFKVPKVFRVVDEIPRTPLMKVDRPALQRLAHGA